tara:strand:+ start:486 stop:665 length:180 start_codon:yes stop_codon:yes gene_type:complete
MNITILALAWIFARLIVSPWVERKPQHRELIGIAIHVAIALLMLIVVFRSILAIGETFS